MCIIGIISLKILKRKKNCYTYRDIILYGYYLNHFESIMPFKKKKLDQL